MAVHGWLQCLKLAGAFPANKLRNIAFVNGKQTPANPSMSRLIKRLFKIYLNSANL